MGVNVAIVGLLLSMGTISDQLWAPSYHLSPKKGWTNDPNGLSYFDGYYHAFYQHNPNAPVWGSMHWGHARSKDMLSWEHLPIALAPSIPEDIEGIFSGSAVVDNNNLTVMYTGVSGNNYEEQVQCLATSSDGINFVKNGVVLRKDGDNKDFRDPKVWRQDNSWFVVIGSRTFSDGGQRGQVLLYKSPDLHNWESQGVLAQADAKLGFMWECPDFFTLGDKQILLVSPQGIESDGYDYQNPSQTGYFVGTWTPGSEYKIEKKFREIDHGHDFYAAQTFLAPDGRRILIGWMASSSVFPESREGWAGMLTLPRELTLTRSGDIEIRPIREVKDRRRKSNPKQTNLVLNETSFFEENVASNEIYVTVIFSSCL